VTSLSRRQSRVWITLVISRGWCSSPFNSNGFCYHNEWDTSS